MKQLRLDVHERRARAAARLMGRKRIHNEEEEPPSLSAAQRILHYLLTLPSAQARRDVLPEAFESPDSTAGETYDAETEQLSTTPLQLLQVCIVSNSTVGQHARHFS